MNTIEIDSSNIHVLEELICNDFTPFFRYFHNKTADQIIKNHYKTILLLNEKIPIAYAHIDYDIIHDMYWLGCCVVSSCRNQGMGTKCMEIIMELFWKSPISTLYLTVDKENVHAIKLYKKYGFTILRNTDHVYVMNCTKKNLICVPVSFGEAIDKLTILDIKQYLIVDQRKEDVIREFHTLQHHLTDVLGRVSIYYEMLKQINLQIWNDQDTFRYSCNEEEKTMLCKKIIEDNDARFRIKHKINVLLSSTLKEQKGYRPKTYSILYNSAKSSPELDCIILYQSIFHDTISICCSSEQESFLLSKYKEDPSILVTPQSGIEIPSNYIEMLQNDIKNKAFFTFLVEQMNQTTSSQ